MQLQIIQTTDEFHTLSAEWNTLLAKSANNIPFLRHEYLTTWWNTLGGGEWSQGELYIILGRDQAGSLQGIAPLFLHEKTVMFIGSHEISDYLDFIAFADQLEPFIAAVLDHFMSDTAPAWDMFDLYNLVEGTDILTLLEAGARQRGFTYTQEQIQPAPRIPLAENWEAYLENIQGKQRREMRRKLRRAESFYAPVEWYIVEDESQLNDEIDAFMTLMAYDPEKEKFLTDVMSGQMRAAVHTAFRAGWLQLAFLTVGGEKAAAYLNFDYDNQIWVYNSGINFKFQELSPGWVLLAHLIQWAIARGRTTFDMLRGAEVYKYRFGGVDQFVMRVQIRK
ncbi:MAG: GNAT family N-acetyltransferase [Anaerolineae bacterium]|nr:GNAT family N-acetyltransferase [Anaerolineae bacterium]